MLSSATLRNRELRKNLGHGIPTTKKASVELRARRAEKNTEFKDAVPPAKIHSEVGLAIKEHT